MIGGSRGTNLGGMHTGYSRDFTYTAKFESKRWISSMNPGISPSRATLDIHSLRTLDNFIFLEPLTPLTGMLKSSNPLDTSVASLPVCQTVSQLDQWGEMQKDHIARPRNASNLIQERDLPDQRWRDDTVQMQGTCRYLSSRILYLTFGRQYCSKVKVTKYQRQRLLLSVC